MRPMLLGSCYWKYRNDLRDIGMASQLCELAGR